MKKSLYIFCLLLFIVSCRKVVETKRAHRFLSIEGQDIVKPDGEKFLICGVNLANWLSPEGNIFHFDNSEAMSYRAINEAFNEMVGPDFTKEFWRKFKENYITENDIKHIKESGMNSIRIPFHYKLFTNEDYMGLDTAQDGFEHLDRVIEWSRKHGLYVILDMQAAPGGQTGEGTDDGYNYPWLMESENSKELFCSIWKDIAQHYANDTIVLGYDLLNEPISEYFLEKYPHLGDSLEPLYKRCMDSIRKVDNNHIVIFEGTQSNNNFRVFKDPRIDKVMYSTHLYPGDISHPDVQSIIRFRDSTNIPIYIGETGGNAEELKAWTQWMNENNIGLHYWPYKQVSSGSCMLVIRKPKNWEVIENFTRCSDNSREGVYRCRPDGLIVEKSMNELLENMKFENCEIKDDFL